MDIFITELDSKYSVYEIQRGIKIDDEEKISEDLIVDILREKEIKFKLENNLIKLSST